MTMITCLILRIPAAATNVPPWPPTVRSRPPGADGLGGVHAASVTATSAPAATRPAGVTPMHLRLMSAAPPARTPAGAPSGPRRRARAIHAAARPAASQIPGPYLEAITASVVLLARDHKDSPEKPA